MILQAWMIVLGLLPISIASAQGGGADPGHCVVDPWDHHNTVFVSPGSPPDASDVDRVTVKLVDWDGNLMPNIIVEIGVGGCTNLCRDPLDDGLTPTRTNMDGIAVFNPKIGGCDDCRIFISANGVVIREYTRIRSTDWSGTFADGRVGPWDEPDVNDLCYDFNGDGSVGPDDLARYAEALGDSNAVPCPLSPTGVGEGTALGSTDLLGSPYPNPAQSRVHVPVRLSRDAHLEVQIFDPAGRIVTVLVDREMGAGDHEFVWDMQSDQGANAPTGVYFIKAASEGERSTRMFVLHK